MIYINEFLGIQHNVLFIYIYILFFLDYFMVLGEFIMPVKQRDNCIATNFVRSFINKHERKDKRIVKKEKKIDETFG